eukprot:gb/GFBE01035827.1/.p1 GENE.gb/GFBE01035827.1/~~gb/GFBE01035827.1/.p1  ORF type:complete len:313 (+),score=16.68 gb/GFBE01035827.1/:1-939(+)
MGERVLFSFFVSLSLSLFHDNASRTFLEHEGGRVSAEFHEWESCFSNNMSKWWECLRLSSSVFQSPSAAEASKSASAICGSMWDDARKTIRPIQILLPTLTGLHGRKYLHVHVGKTGGSTFELLLHQAKATDWEQIHMQPLSTTILQGRKQVVFLIRDPLERIISAFNFHKRRVDAGTARKSDDLNTLFRCFQTVDAFSRALDENTTCGGIARDRLFNSSSSQHISNGYCFYVGGVLEELARARVSLIYARSLITDAQALLDRLGITINATSVHANAAPDDSDKFLSHTGRTKLLSHLAHEYYALHALMRLS